MAKFDEPLAAFLSTHHGVAASADLTRLGVSDRERRTLVTRGRLVRLQHGLFVAADSPATDLRALAVACAASGGVLGGVSAGRLWGFRKLPALPLPTVLMPDGGATRTKLADAASTQDLLPRDIVRRDDGISLTSPVRTVFDLAAVLPDDDLESVVEQALNENFFLLHTLDAVASRLKRPGKAGGGAMSRLVQDRRVGLAPVDSDLELRFERALVRAGLARPERQFAVKLIDATIHIDFAWPSERLALEIDHSTWHSGRAATANDKQRDRKLARLGWRCLRVTELDIRLRLGDTVADVREVLGATSGQTCR